MSSRRPELGFRLLQKLAEDVDEFGFVESSPKQDGRNMIMVLGPHKKKTEAKAEVKAERDRRDGRARRPTRRRSGASRRDVAHKLPRQPRSKKRRGPADNLDPDIDLS